MAFSTNNLPTTGNTPSHPTWAQRTSGLSTKVERPYITNNKGQKVVHMKIYEALYLQYLSRICVKNCKDADKALLEVTFPPNKQHTIAKACKEGVFFQTVNTVVCGAPALGADVEIHRLALSHLPKEMHESLLEGLRNTLVHYGRVLDLGLSFETEFKTFLGTRYAVLNIAPYKDEEGDDITFESSFQKMPYMDTANCFHVLTSTLPKWCRYCHKNGHKRDICLVCPNIQWSYWICNELGHTKANCPHDAAFRAWSCKVSSPNGIDIDKKELEHLACKTDEEHLAQEQAAPTAPTATGAMGKRGERGSLF